MLIIEVFVLEINFSEPLTCDMRSMSEETGHSVLIQLRLNDSPISQKRNIKKLDKNGTVDLIISQTKTPIPISFVFLCIKSCNN